MMRKKIKMKGKKKIRTSKRMNKDRNRRIKMEKKTGKMRKMGKMMTKMGNQMRTTMMINRIKVKTTVNQKKKRKISFQNSDQSKPTNSK